MSEHENFWPYKGSSGKERAQWYKEQCQGIFDTAASLIERFGIGSLEPITHLDKDNIIRTRQMTFKETKPVFCRFTWQGTPSVEILSLEERRVFDSRQNTFVTNGYFMNLWEMVEPEERKARKAHVQFVLNPRIITTPLERAEPIDITALRVILRTMDTKLTEYEKDLQDK